MKTFLAIISAMNAKLTVLTDKSAALKKQPKTPAATSSVCEQTSLSRSAPGAKAVYAEGIRSCRRNCRLCALSAQCCSRT